MGKGLRGRFIIILLVLIVATLLVLPTLGVKTMSVEVKPEKLSEAKNDLAVRFPEKSYDLSYDGNTINIKGINLNNAIMNGVKLNDYVVDAEIMPHWSEKYLMANKIKLGLDLQGGMNIVLQPDYKGMEEGLGRTIDDDEKTRMMSQALEKLGSRINSTGVAEPLIRPRGTESIEVQLPGVSDPESVKKLLKSTGKVSYHIVDDEWTSKVLAYFKEKQLEVPKKDEDLKALLKSIEDEIGLPENFKIFFQFARTADTNELYAESPLVLQKKESLSGDDIKTASIGVDEYQKPAVHFTLKQAGAEKFAKVTGDNVGHRMAIVIDNQVRSAPNINSKITGGSAQITGSFTQAEVEMLANVIKEGALPVSLMVVEERTVGPSLGQDSIEAGYMAIAIGLAGIMIFMVIYYKLSGLIADACLLLNMIFILAIFSWLKATLTLPGIAGFILTVGMSVDANVIIFERIKEEIKKGKSPRVAVSNGFGRAFWTIFDANLTTMIAAFILSQIGSGPIKGFAVTLVVGIICSMFSALYISRFVFEFVVFKRDLKKLSI